MNRDTALEHLHPVFRDKVQTLTQQFVTEQLPFRLFEGFRTPQRQRDLFAQGRTAPGDIVTKAEPWWSYHQFGIAGDFVLYIDGQWSWDDGGPRRKWWTRLHELARGVGLEPLSWEAPHLQVAGLNINALRAGGYPLNGDESWADNLENAIHAWSGDQQPPPVPQVGLGRPPIPAEALAQALPMPAAAALPRYRVIARSGLRLRAGPGTEFDVLGSLSAGQTVTVRAKKGDWCQIDTEGDGFADGYCHGGFLAPVA